MNGMLWLLIVGFGFSIQAQDNSQCKELPGDKADNLKLFLCGDVMTGRGIDQALPFPVDPVLYESWVKNARIYLQKAEQNNGKIKTPLSWETIWGDALKVWKKNQPNFKLINLETSITTFPEPWPGKGIHYRMNPRNINTLSVPGIDYCSLANNHTMDWGTEGLHETLRILERANISFSGAGLNEREAAKPAVLSKGRQRILVYSYATSGSGVPQSWQATKERPGVNLLPDFSKKEVLKIKQQVRNVKRKNDVVIFSIHWGNNWGYSIPPDHREFAHLLLKETGVDLIYGHSSHHPLGIEVYHNKCIIYGAGDFINDYEGISGHEKYRGELTLMYFPELETETGNLKTLKMIPMKIRNFRLNYPDEKEVIWLQSVLDRESKKLGAGVKMGRQCLMAEMVDTLKSKKPRKQKTGGILPFRFSVSN